jgi:RimJ/RimL family protein N-acetyltransferase
MVPVPTDAGLPEAYPKHLESSFEVRDGRTIWVRAILPSDAADLADAVERADRETLLHRFFTAAPHLTDRQIHYLAEVDYRRRLALIARDAEGRGVAVARYECHPETNTAEVAVAVAPEWRRLGIATELLRRLEEPARENGFEVLDAVYLPDNHAVARVFERLGYSSPRIEDGLASVSKALV